MSKYSIALINISPHLDLTKKRKEIESALKDIRSMKVGLLAF